MQNSDTTISDILNDDSKDLNHVFSTIPPNDNDDSNETTNDLKDSEYYTETELTDFLKKKKISDRTHLKLLTLNIANLLSKQRSLKLLVENISNEANRPNIIAITETHLNESRNQGYSDSELKGLLPGYQFFHKDRKTMKGGGVGVFVENRLADDAKIETGDFFMEEIFEGIVLKIPNFPLKSGKKNLIILTVYRQPSKPGELGKNNLKKFLETMERWLEKYDRRGNEIFVTGDLNLDLLKYDTHPPTSEYLDLMVSYELLPAITRPTRIKHASATLIDHIFSKLTCMNSGILVSELAGSHGYTDHYPIFSIIEIGKQAVNKRNTMTSRYFTTSGHRARREGLRQENWTEFYRETDPNTAYMIFHDIYCKHYNDSITTKTHDARRNKYPRQPWMTNEILHKMQKRDRIAKNKERRAEYQQLRNDIVQE